MLLDSFSRHGFARVAAAVPHHLVDPGRQRRRDHRARPGAADDHAALVVFPELGLTGYSDQDLFHQQPLLDAALAALDRGARATTATCRRWSSSGCRCASGRQLFNVAAVLHRRTGARRRARRATCPTTASSTRSGTSARRARRPSTRSRSFGDDVPFGTDLLFAADRPARPRGRRSRSARTSGCRSRRARSRRWPARPCVANLSGSNITIGKAGYRRQLCSAQSARTISALRLRRRRRGRVDHRPRVGRPRASIAENGNLLAESRALRATSRCSSPPTSTSTGWSPTACARRASPTAVEDHRERLRVPPRRASSSSADATASPLRRRVARFPFVPGDPAERDERCAEVYAIQAQRARDAAARDRHRASVVIGVSGGLDSTQALLVARAAHGRPRRCRARTCWPTRCPGFATSDRTLAQRAPADGRARRARADEIDIRPAAHADAARPRPPAARGRAGLRRHLRERAGRRAHVAAVPPGQPARRARRRHRRPVASWRSGGAPTASATTCRTTA